VMKSIEILDCYVKQASVEEFLRIEKERIAKMAYVSGCMGRIVLKKLSNPNSFFVCTKWNDRNRAIEYCGERLSRERFKNFVQQYLEGIKISFLEEAIEDERIITFSKTPPSIYELFICIVKQGKFDEFIKIEKKVKEEVETKNGFLGRIVLKGLEVNQSIVCTRWQSREIAFSYRGGTMQRPVLPAFIKNSLDGLQITWLEEVDFNSV